MKIAVIVLGMSLPLLPMCFEDPQQSEVKSRDPETPKIPANLVGVDVTGHKDVNTP